MEKIVITKKVVTIFFFDLVFILLKKGDIMQRRMKNIVRNVQK